MFKKLFGKNNEASKDITVYAPISGELVKIEDIPDPVFAQKMMGEGFGVQPIEGTVVSPIDGVVDNVFPTKHAISLKADNGLEVLVHIGLILFNLMVKDLKFQLKVGDRVKMGDALVSFDLEFIKQNAKSTVSPIIITNTASTESIQFEEPSHLSKGETSVIEVKMK